MKKSCTAILAGAALSALMLTCFSGCTDVNGKAFDDPQVTVTVGKVSEAKDISDLLFGVFLEDINFASYALDDNLIANGNFEHLDGIPTGNRFGEFWTATDGASLAVQDDSEGGILSGVAEYKAQGVNPHYAKVTVTSAGGGLSNSGYQHPAMAIGKGEEYTFSAFIKADSAAKATAKVVDEAGKTYLSATFNVKQNASWVKYSVTKSLKGKAKGTEGLRFELTFDTAGTYLVDAVQLETKESTVGIKNYIYEAVEELAPKFMRFPGGCIIEGDAGNGAENTKEVYDWKNSVGAVQNGENAGDDTVPAFVYTADEDGSTSEKKTYGEWATRANNFDLWGYNMDYGLGFYEYFLLCEKLGASPVPIVNCGYSDQGGAASGGPVILSGRHGKEVADYVQDALNLIEFANGGTDTKWGKIRSDMGHPAPFNMKYIGVGNEQFTREYYECYEQFLEAFRAAQKENPSVYGGVQPIVGNGMAFSDALGGPPAYRAYLADSGAKAYVEAGKIANWAEYGVVDHHYYMGYNDFFTYATPEKCVYDKYDREGDKAYKVFVGEYSANAATDFSAASKLYETNTWMTALSEAAYMTGLERNGDVVDLAAYAPMFGVSDGEYRDDDANQWDVDMMYFTNTELLRSPNYYVQQLFMRNSGTKGLATSVQYADSFQRTIMFDMLSALQIERFYQSAVYDEATGDIIVKLVNAGDNHIRVNVDLSGASVGGKADCVRLEGRPDAINTLEKEGMKIEPKDFTLGMSGLFGYNMPAYCAVAIRIHTK